MCSVPNVLREGGECFSRISLLDSMFQRREVELVGEINEQSAQAVIRQLRHLHFEAPEQEITMFINSSGGEVPSGLALYDTMRAIKCPIRTVCMGFAGSIAAVLFAAGDRRDMLPHSELMIHDPSIRIGGSALRVAAISGNLMESRRAIASIISERTGHSLEEVFAKTSADCYFTAEQAVEWGLADAVIHEF